MCFQAIDCITEVIFYTPITQYHCANYKVCNHLPYRLINCGVTDEGCVALTSALGSNPSHLRELDLSDNKLGDSVKLLSALKDDPYYKLDRLNCYCEYISYKYYIQYLHPHTHNNNILTLTVSK